MTDHDEVALIRLREENNKLRAENAVLRPMISDLQHRLRLAERQPHHLPSTGNTALVRKNREHG